MRRLRIIPRLDIKGSNLIKGIHLEGLRVVGDPGEFARRYYAEGADELVYMDVVASLYGRNSLVDLVKRTSQDIFIPLTVGGGVRSVDDARELLRSGADKVAINTAAVAAPSLLSDLSRRFGSQAVVLSVEAKRVPGGWEAYTDNGRERTGLSVVDWIQRGVELGAGEVLLTSVDQEGTRKGFDVELVAAVTRAVNVPVIASGGFGSAVDLEKIVFDGGADAVAIADALHYRRAFLADLKRHATGSGIPVRQ